MKRKLTLIERAEILWNLPKEEPPVFDSTIDNEPASEYVYSNEPRDKVVISKSVFDFASITEAEARIQPFLKHRKLVVFRKFQTAQFYVFWCTPKSDVEEDE